MFRGRERQDRVRKTCVVMDGVGEGEGEGAAKRKQIGEEVRMMWSM